MNKNGTIEIRIRLPDKDQEWVSHSLMTVDELIDLGVILKDMKKAGVVKEFNLVHLHVKSLGLSETLASLPQSIRQYIPPAK